jgi:hypothetical protein
MLVVPGQRGQRIVLYHSAGNKYSIDFVWDDRAISTEVKIGDGPYRSLSYGAQGVEYFKTSSGAVNQAKVVRNGRSFAVSLNGHELFVIDESIWMGDVGIGLGAYGAADYVRVCVRDAEGTRP